MKRKETNNEKRLNSCIIVVAQGEERKKGKKKHKEIRTKIVPNLGIDANFQVQELQSSPMKFSPKKSTPKHIIIKLSKKTKKKF